MPEVGGVNNLPKVGSNAYICYRNCVGPDDAPLSYIYIMCVVTYRRTKLYSSAHLLKNALILQIVAENYY